MSRASKLATLPRNRQLMLLETTFWLFVARLIVFVPLARWSRFLGEMQAQTPFDEGDTARNEQVRLIRWGVRIMSRNVPWRSDCLPRALAAKIMLQRRRIPNTLYFGVAKNVQNGQLDLEAHAWLRSGCIMVTGAEEARRFRAISSFAKHYK